MANDPVADALAGAKAQLAKGAKFTQSVEGNPTSMFAPPKTPTHIENVPSYHIVRTARKANDAANQEAKSLGEGLKARVEQNKAAE